MTILGIHGDYFNPERPVWESNAAVVIDGRIVSAVSEERLSREKLDGRFPWASIQECLRLARLDISEVDEVVFATRTPLANILSYAKSTFTTFMDTFVLPRNTKKMKSHGVGLASRMNGKAFFSLNGHSSPSSEQRTFPIRFVDHHYAHAAGAYYTSPFSDALVITLDGGGDGLDGGAYMAKGTRLERFIDIPHFQSPGTIYSAITYDLGFKRHRHEGKITGLAAYGRPDIEGMGLQNLIRYDRKKHRFISRAVAAHHVDLNTKSAYLYPLLKAYSREDVSATVQEIFEKVTLDFIEDAAQEAARRGFRSRNICLAGGCFSNVKLNQRVLDMGLFDNILIYPAMGDGGLGSGAALYYHYQQYPHTDKKISEIDHVYLGASFSTAEMRAAIEKHHLGYTRHDNIEEIVGQLLAEGKVVARFEGAMEYGPRALGNRSILAAPFDATINDWLNDKLHRTEFMPFAPSMTIDRASEFLQGYRPDHKAADFMTITYDMKPGVKQKIPAVVHVDNTARPQVVRRSVNESYYNIIKAFERHTNIPVILNTSFNIHEEPIVCTPDEAIKGFLGAQLDYLAMGPFLVPLPD